MYDYKPACIAFAEASAEQSQQARSYYSNLSLQMSGDEGRNASPNTFKNQTHKPSRF